MAALPVLLKEAIEGRLAGLSGRDLAKAYEGLSQAYHGQAGKIQEADENFWMAYLASRLPATYAALTAALESLKTSQPQLKPLSLCDLGAGPGTASWAALQAYPSLEKLTLIEKDPRASRLSAGFGLPGASFVQAELDSGNFEPADLVVAGYVLGELPPDNLRKVVLKAWASSRLALLLVEPGTPAGFRRIRSARDWLLEAGARIAAPCTHPSACPMTGEDWCHFAARLERSSLHRQVKGGSLGHEDEKFSYLAVVRTAAPAPEARRILRHPRLFKGHLRLDLCGPEGKTERTVSRKDGETYKRARKASWGDLF